MTPVEHFAPTAEIRRAVSGREVDVLAELGIACTAASQHINCPYPTHADRHPSWRRDASKACAFCTCTKDFFWRPYNFFHVFRENDDEHAVSTGPGVP